MRSSAFTSLFLELWALFFFKVVSRCLFVSGIAVAGNALLLAAQAEAGEEVEACLCALVQIAGVFVLGVVGVVGFWGCLLYTSPSPRD